MNNNQIETFLKISAYLTGYSQVDLLGTGMVGVYYGTIVENTASSIVDYFFQTAEEILNSSEGDETLMNEGISKKLMPDNCYNGLAKTIISVWYTGNWGSNVINPDSYKQGLMWDTAGAHPPGAKQPGYGSWSIEPFVHVYTPQKQETKSSKDSKKKQKK